MPERAPESGVDGGERSVKLSCQNRNTLWLCTEDVLWVITYLRDQLQAKGVPHVEGDDRGPGSKPAVEGAESSTAETPEPVQQSSPPTSSSSAGVHGHAFAARSAVIAADIEVID